MQVEKDHATAYPDSLGNPFNYCKVPSLCTASPVSADDEHLNIATIAVNSLFTSSGPRYVYKM